MIFFNLNHESADDVMFCETRCWLLNRCQKHWMSLATSAKYNLYVKLDTLKNDSSQNCINMCKIIPNNFYVLFTIRKLKIWCLLTRTSVFFQIAIV